MTVELLVTSTPINIYAVASLTNNLPILAENNHKSLQELWGAVAAPAAPQECK